MNEARLRPVPPDEDRGTLVDSNVLLDVINADPTWSDCSGKALADARDRGDLIINPIVYAEISVRFDRMEELDAVLGDPGRAPVPDLLSAPGRPRARIACTRDPYRS